MTLILHIAADDVRAGRRTPVDLVNACLDRIDRYEPRVKAWVFVDRDGARWESERLTDELRRGNYRGPLHGIPIAVKDIFDVFDWPTAAGSRLWANSIARHDATVVAKLRQAGAIFLGKTVTTQYASFDPPPTRNPWNLERTPGGSSSGSAAAVACGMCYGALASQTGGSITRPAAYCGVPGCKPTWGRVSKVGVVPLAPSMDHVGVMAGCVRDLAILLQIIGGHDPRDPESSPSDMPDLTARLAEGSPSSRAPRLGRLRGLFEEQAAPSVRAEMQRVHDRFLARGAHVVDVALPASFSEVLARHRTVMAVEAAAYHEPRLRRHPEDYGPNITKLLKEGLTCPASEYARCKEHQAALQAEMQNLLRNNAALTELDAFLTPATTGPAPDLSTTGDPAFNSPWSYTGLPTVSVPAGRSADDLPLSIQLVGNAFDEPRLFQAAAWCEAALDMERREPRL